MSEILTRQNITTNTVGDMRLKRCCDGGFLGVERIDPAKHHIAINLRGNNALAAEQTDGGCFRCGSGGVKSVKDYSDDEFHDVSSYKQLRFMWPLVV